MKGTPIEKEEVKLSLSTDDMTSCTENPRELTHARARAEEAVQKRPYGAECLPTLQEKSLSELTEPFQLQMFFFHQCVVSLWCLSLHTC